MTTLWIAIGTVEWCVLGFIAGMAVLAAVLKPPHPREAMTIFMRGTLAESRDDNETADGTPELEVFVGDERIEITRRGFDGELHGLGGAVSLAATVVRNNITIMERITSGTGPAFKGEVEFDTKDFRLSGNYHVRYVSESLSRSTTFSLLLRPGVHVKRMLLQ